MEATLARRDLREGGRWSALQRIKNDAIFFAACGALAAVRLVPTGGLRAFGRSVAALARLLWPAARRLAEANVRRVFPDRDAHALVRANYRALGEHLGDALASLRGDPLVPLPFPSEARRVFDDALAEGRGVVFASAHLGPWERVAATLVAEGVPLTVVTREAYDPRFDALYTRLRGGRGVTAIPRGTAGAGKRMLRVLRSGGVLGIPMDLASRVPSVDAPFLGLPAKTPSGPARLALRTGAAVVVATVDPVGRVTATRIDTRETDETTLTTRINDALSARIRAMPEAWVWMHERWPTTEGDARPR